MINPTNKSNAGISRRSLLKTGLALAGGAILPSASKVFAVDPINKNFLAGTERNSVPGRHKLGTL